MIDPNRLILAHFRKDEIDLLDQIQGGTNFTTIKGIDGELTNIRQYPDLIFYFAKPEVREVFENAVTGELDKKEKKDIKEYIDFETEDFLEDNINNDPLVEKIKDEGIKKDDEIALVPAAVLDYFDSLLGKPDINKNTGLPQYGFFKNPFKAITAPFRHPAKWIKQQAQNPIVRMGAQIGTAIATGGMSLPAQMAASAAVGTGLGVAAGEKFSTALKQGAIEGLTTGAAARLKQSLELGKASGALATGGTHYAISSALGKGDIKQSLLRGVGDYAISSFADSPKVSSAAPDLAKGVNAGDAKPMNFFDRVSSGLGSAYDKITSPFSSASTPTNDVFEAAANAAKASEAGFFGMGGVLGSGLTGGQLAAIAGAGYLLKRGKDAETKKLKESLASAQNQTLEANKYIDELAQGQYYPQSDDTYSRYNTPSLAPFRSNYGQINPSYPDMPIEYAEPLVQNPYSPSYEDLMMGYEHDWFVPKSKAISRRPFKKGGNVESLDVNQKGLPGEAHLIVGKGKGQDDLIPYDYLDKGDYIIDASSVSDLGDGSTRAGERELFKLINSLKHKPISVTKTTVMKTITSKVPALLSDGEFRIPNHIVTNLGQGDNEKGAKILDKFRKLLRKDKIKNGTKLPPKAKPIETYIKKAGGKI